MNPTTILYGTTLQVSFTVTRESTDNFPGGLVVLMRDAENNDVPIYLNSNFKLNNNKSANISFEIILENEDLSAYLDENRVLKIIKFIVVFGKSPEIFGSIKVISYSVNFIKTKGFSIDSVLFRRAKRVGNEVKPDDEGTLVLSDLKISTAGTSGTSPENLKLICYYSDGQVSTSSTPINWIGYIDDAMSDDGIVNSSELVTKQNGFDTTKNWHFMIVFGDDYERTVVYSDLSDAFANVHLSGCGKGVAFGKFSASTLEHPLFECRYPARIDGINVFDSTATQDIETGGTMNGSPIYRRMIIYEYDPQENQHVFPQIINVENVVNISGIAEVTFPVPIDGSTSFSFPVPFYDGTIFFRVVFDKTKNKVLAEANVKCTFYVTIDYTKQ